MASWAEKLWLFLSCGASNRKSIYLPIDDEETENEEEFKYARDPQAPILSAPNTLPAENHFTIIKLDSLIENNPEALQQLKQQLEGKGWAVVKLPKRFSVLTERLFPKLHNFFLSDMGEKYKFFGGIGTGFNCTSHKETLHYATGTAWSPSNIPKSFNGTLTALAREFDKALLDITLVGSEPIFGISKKDWKNLEFPLLHDPATHPNRFNLLDIAYYYNQPKNSDPEINCAAHHDPGLWSLSIFQNNPGLQLFDPVSNTWYDGPLDTKLGLIWAGQAASDLTKGAIKPCIHKVVYLDNPNFPRLSIWAELCTASQLIDPNKSDNITWDKDNTKLVVTNLDNPFFEQPYEVPVQNGNVAEALALSERLLGLPSSKISYAPVFNNLGQVVGLEKDI